jgi:hypothetical protein
MFVSNIVKLLPASLDWMVLFNLAALTPMFDDITIKKMFFIPDNVELALFSHAVLTSAGLRLATKDGNGLVNPENGRPCAPIGNEPSLLNRFSKQLAMFALDEADCLGAGEIPPFFPPVVLHIKIRSGHGEAKAIFFQIPSQFNYELLQAVGVCYVSGEWLNEGYLAHFTVDLSQHIHSGTLSDFSKTGYCNAFFLQHGSIGPTLEGGLIGASKDWINHARNLGLNSVNKLANQAIQQTLTMFCYPPPPKEPFPFGDLVPLGFLARSLSMLPDPSSCAAFQELRQYLISKRQEGLWSFQSGDIPTATDSALILLGISDPEAISSLEIFSDGCGGYYPQLWSRDRQAGKMVVDKSTRHWCQSDYPTTCLVRALRRNAGLAPLTTIDYLKKAFPYRSGLYFANPYLVDWTLAQALVGDETADEMRAELRSEILASINPDYSFGKFDPALSTAFAILSLALLGVRDRILFLAQRRLSDFMLPDGTWPEAIPFYSTFRLPDFPSDFTETSERLLGSQDQIVSVGGAYYAISYYVDRHKLISTAIATLALSEEASPTRSNQETDKNVPAVLKSRPRYGCANQSEYIRRFALPPYAKPESCSTDGNALIL